MIEVKKINGDLIYLSAEQIRSVEKCPDTLITLLDGSTLLSQDRPEDIIARIRDWFRSYRMEERSWS